jgi:hypothetical protein
MEKNKTKVIINAGVARNLLRAGCTIVDIKASKFNKAASVFVFNADDKFNAEFAKINEEIVNKSKQVVAE